MSRRATLAADVLATPELTQGPLPPVAATPAGTLPRAGDAASGRWLLIDPAKDRKVVHPFATS